MIDLDSDTAFNVKVLDALMVRTKATLHNLANQNVPGFKRYTVRFEDLLQQAKSSGEDLASVDPVVERDESGPPGANNVDLVQEMTVLDKTRLLHDLFSRRIGSHFANLNRAIFGR